MTFSTFLISPGIRTNLYVYLPRVGFVILSVGYSASLLRDLIRGERQREKHKILLNIFREKNLKNYFKNYSQNTPTHLKFLIFLKIKSRES